MSHHSHAHGKRVLLPTHVLPSHYYLHLTPEIDASTFKGTISIDLYVKKETPSNIVTLHSLNLAIDKSQIKLKRFAPGSLNISAELSTDTFTTNEEEETVTFEFGGQPFKVGEKLSLSLAFSGSIDDPGCGLYHSNYVVNGETKYVFLIFIFFGLFQSNQSIWVAQFAALFFFSFFFLFVFSAQAFFPLKS
jgi:aminopeptidase N